MKLSILTDIDGRFVGDEAVHPDMYMGGLWGMKLTLDKSLSCSMPPKVSKQQLIQVATSVSCDHVARWPHLCHVTL